MQATHSGITTEATFGKAGLALALLSGALLAAAPARAQNLRLGKSGVSTSNGTATLTDTGTTASGTFGYDPGSSGLPLAQQTNYKGAWNVYGTSTANAVGGSISYFYANDTSTTNVSGGTIGGDLANHGSFSAGNSSRVNVTGGDVKQLYAYNTSKIDVSGGQGGYFETRDASMTSVSGGSVGEILAYNASITNVSGGSVGELVTYNTSKTNVSGGSIVELIQSGTGSTTISGGAINDFQAYSNTDVSGGSFKFLNVDSYNSYATVDVTGGSFTHLSTSRTGTLDLFGTGLAATYGGQAFGRNFYDISGTLQNGDTLKAYYQNPGGGRLEFNGKLVNPVPEACSAISLGLLLALGLGGMVFARRRAV